MYDSLVICYILRSKQDEMKTDAKADKMKRLVFIKLADSLKKKHLHRYYTLTDREKLENRA